MSQEAKLIRKQVRNVVQEILGEVLSAELKSALYADLDKKVMNKVEAIAKHIKSALDQIDERSKNTQDYVLRQGTMIPSQKLSENIIKAKNE